MKQIYKNQKIFKLKVCLLKFINQKHHLAKQELKTFILIINIYIIKPIQSLKEKSDEQNF